MVIVFAGAFEKGVGQIEQRDGFLDIEQRTMLPVDKGLDLSVMWPQQVRGTIQSGQTLLCIIAVQQFAQRTVLLQPLVRG
jgi:hypothetical protein